MKASTPSRTRPALIDLRGEAAAAAEAAVAGNGVQGRLGCQRRSLRSTCWRFFMHQIFELVDGLYQRVRTFFSSRRCVLGRGAVRNRRLPVVSVYLVGPGAGTDELAARAVAPLWAIIPNLTPRSPTSHAPTTMPRAFARGPLCGPTPASRSLPSPTPESARLRRLARSVRASPPLGRVAPPCMLRDRTQFDPQHRAARPLTA